MKHISVMLKPASSLCNMRCRYCFYADVSSLREVASFGMMTRETADAVIGNIFADMEAGDHLTFAFQGGEPTLAGLDYFRHFTDAADDYASRGVKIHYAIQTNGLLLDDDWCGFLHEHGFLVGLSLDGESADHNENRTDSMRKGTFRRVIQAKERLERHHVEYNILTVLTNQMARHPQQYWRFIGEQNLRYVQLIPCLGPLDGADSVYALTPKRYANFYIALFDLWYENYRRGNYVSVKLFDDLINLMAFGRCNACGLLGSCRPQIVVEADGSVYPCDFYVLDQYCAGSLKTQSLREVYESPVMERFAKRESGPLPLCGDCRYRGICGGGCRRMRREVFYRPGADTCGHKIFLDASIDRLQQLALASREAALRA